MRRGIFLICSLAIASLAITGCGGGGSDDKTPTAEVAPTQPPSPKDLTPQEIVEKLKGSVVNIFATYPQGAGGGTGIVWEDATHVLTNAHVVLGAGSIKIVDPTDSSKQINAKVVAMSPCDDIALLSVDRGNFVPATIGDSSKLQTGEDIVTLGFPGTFTDPSGSKLAVTRGIVSKLGEKSNGLEDLIQTDAAINPGNSGGPMVNKRGEVVGVNTLGTNGQSINYAISINEAKFAADKLKAGKNLDYLGVRLEENYPGLAKSLNIKLAYTDGLLVTGVDTGSPAYKAGFGYSDLIYSIDGVNVSTQGELCDVLRSRKAGDKIEIDMVRTYSDGTFKEFYPEVELQ